jgi:hypothetical protein
LKVADATQRRHRFPDFIIPLRIDDLPHADISIELARLNAIDAGRRIDRVRVRGKPNVESALQ